MAAPDKKMENDKSKLKGIVRLKGFTLLELLIVMSIIVLLMSILLPCLWRAKESAYELFAKQTQVDEEGKVRMEIRKAHDDICSVVWGGKCQMEINAVGVDLNLLWL